MTSNKQDSEPYVLDKISHSKASTYRQCPKRWKYEYIMKRILIRANYATTVGSFVHEVLEALFDLAAEGRTLKNLKSIATQTFETFSTDGDDSEKFKLLHLDEIGIKQFKLDAWKWLVGLWDLEDPTEIEVVANEQRFTKEIGGVMFTGAIDRISQGTKGLIVTDYKTGKPPWGKYERQKLPQILLYSAVVTEDYGERPEYAQLLFLGSKVIGVNPTKGKMDRQVEDLVTTWNDIEDSIKNDDFPAQTGQLCGWCPHVDICDEGQKFVLEGGVNRKDAPAYEVLESLDIRLKV